MHSILPSEAKSSKQTMNLRYFRAHVSHSFFIYFFMLYEASEKLALMKVLCIFWGRKVPSISEIQTDEWLTLNYIKILQVKLLRFSPPPPALIKNSLKPWQSSPLQLVFYPFQLSWLGYLESLGALFILIGTYWIHGKRVWRLRNKSWILSSSFCTVESQTKQR